MLMSLYTYICSNQLARKIGRVLHISRVAYLFYVWYSMEVNGLGCATFKLISGIFLCGEVHLSSFFVYI